MYRQSPGRSHRSKRLKLKHVLQISVLLGLCFWLLYQLKHSHHENNTEFEKNGGAKDEHLSRFGRKDVQDRPTGIVSKDDDEAAAIQDEDVDEDNKLDETAFKRVEETDDEEAEAVGGVTNEQEEDDHLNEPDENEVEENASDEIHGQINDPDVEDDENPSINEAREEHYKADDASSAVTTHEFRAEEEEEAASGTDNNNDIENGSLESDSNSDRRKDSETFDDGGEGEQRNTTTGEDLFDSTSPPNGTRSEGSIEMMVKNNNSDAGEVELQKIQ